MHHRLVLSPRACALAHLLTGYPTESHDTDASLALSIRFSADSAYRALVELSEHGALTFTAAARGTGIRTIRINPDSWVWVYTAQTAQDAEATA